MGFFNKIVFVISVCALISGCTDLSSSVSGTNDLISARTSNVQCVCIGMETSQRFGSCPGCQLDSNRMSSLLRGSFGYPVTLLQSEQATRAAVVKAMKTAIQQTPAGGLFILYYSGHGGQEELTGWNTEEPSDADSADEYLCLYDTYLLDDEIWQLISTCRGRVFLCFDACHSQTLFRSIQGDIARARGLAVPLEDKMVKSHGFTLRPRALTLEASSFNMLCWSGCLEKEYSYGSSVGGVMTTAILKNWERGISYTHLWTLVKTRVGNEQPSQHPACTLYGTGFSEAFR